MQRECGLSCSCSSNSVFPTTIEDFSIVGARNPPTAQEALLLRDEEEHQQTLRDEEAALLVVQGKVVGQ